MPKTEKVNISWDSGSRNSQRRGVREIIVNISGKRRTLPLFGKNSLFNPDVRYHGEFIIITQRTARNHPPNIDKQATFLSPQLLDNQIANHHRVEPVRETLESLDNTTDVLARILLKPVVNGTRATFHDSSTPPYSPIDVTIIRQRQK